MDYLQNLKEDSIHILNTISVTGLWGDITCLDMTETRSKFAGAKVFCTNNSTVAFIDSDGVFVTPYTRHGMAVLYSAGFTREWFYVPFSNGDHPTFEESRWGFLRTKARKSYSRDYEEDCKKWCDEHHIGTLPTEVLDNCFRIPYDGVLVRRSNYESRTCPACNERCVDCTVVDKLGTFCGNNGRVAFVYRDGHTYVTKGYKIINQLQKAGYKESGLYVPFSNGEEIVDLELAKAWAKVSKR